MNNHFHRLFFKAFSNETRFAIIEQLRKRPLTVSEICEKTGFEQSRVSHNLRCLEHCGFVSAERNGKYISYALDKETILPMLDLVTQHIKKYKKKLERCTEVRK